ncbi:MAG: hypothetical protein AB7F36_02725 [Reyranellaceae bacterium]
MGKTIIFGPDSGGDNPATENLEIQTLLGLGQTRRYDDSGNPYSGSFNAVTITGLNYIVPTIANSVALEGIDGNDLLVGTDQGDLVVWEYQLTGLGPSRHLLPSGATTAVDVFDMRGGNDVVNLTYINDGNPGTTDTPYFRGATVFGGLGNDVVWTGHGNDAIFGGGGTTLIGPGSETLSGGAGNDTIFGSSGAFNNIQGGSGNDTLFGGFSSDGIVGESGNDTIYGGAGDDGLVGAEGNDTVYGGGDRDNLDGGDGDDVVMGDTGDDTLTGGASALDSLFGGDNNDVVRDPDGVRIAAGGAGNDRLEITYGSSWASGASTLQGGNGDDTIDVLGLQDSTVQMVLSGDDTTAGADTVTARGSYASMVADLGGGNDTFTYASFTGANGPRIDTVYGGAGNDMISTGAGTDFLFGGDGDDTLQGGTAGDSLYGGTGTDVVSYADSSRGVTVGLTGVVGIGGSAQGDVLWTDVENLTGSDHGDSLYGNTSANVILGLGGDDTIEGRGGADSLDGGAGTNLLSYNTSNAAVVVNLGTGSAIGGHATGDVFANFRNLEGSAFDDILTGDAQANTLSGLSGDDTLAGGAGIDVLFGNQGNDRLLLNAETTYAAATVQGWNGETGSAPVSYSLGGEAIAYVDFAFGGQGTDTIDIRAQSNTAAAQGRVTVYTPPSSSVSGFVGGIEIITAAAATDIVNLTWNDGGTRVAYASSITVATGGGGDVIFSGSGDDLLIGGSLIGTAAGTDGADLIYGGAGNDVIFGDDQDPLSLLGGADTLYGGLGSDTISGGVGDDTLYGGAALDSLFGGAGNDRIFADIAANAFGGDGSDLIVATFASPADSFTITGGLDDVATDGADAVYVAGSYARIDASLGAGQDRYIASSTDSGAPQVDRVFGEIGNDLISTWYGDDMLDGGGASDALWGGAGSDTIYGGGGTDYLYGGWGDNDVLVGGAGTDYYYWSRTDGQGDQIFDDFRGTPVLPGQQADNVLVVFPDFDPTETSGDGLRTGSGVVETNRDLHDLAGGDDMVQLTDIDGASGTMWRLTVLNGDGATNYVEFDQRDVQTILLWNNDAAGTGQIIQTYTWDPVDGRYEYVG